MNSTGRQATIDHILTHCGGLRPDECIVIICDAETRAVAEPIADRAKELGAKINHFEIPALTMHGAEPPSEVATAMQEASLVLGLTRLSMAHSQARLAACRAGARYLSMPDYSLELLGDRSLQADFRAHYNVVRRIADAFTAGSRVEVRTARGTDISLNIADRMGNCCPGYVAAPGELGSPPDIEANVSPVETDSEGTIVVDGSIPYPGLGLLDAPITLTISGGSIVDMQAPNEVMGKLRDVFEKFASSKVYVLAECGVGLNELAELTGHMLTDEGAAGTMHFGFGSNATVGGLNDVPFHLDAVFRAGTLSVDGLLLLREGKLTEHVQ